MQTNLAPSSKDTPEGSEAEAILRKCVHCGFCTATCPTYQLLGDELDGPRGRIYLMKQVLEGAPVTRSTQLHLDRCLTCRNCETTCPSGVQYGNLVDIVPPIVDERVERPAGERALRWLLKEGLTSPLFAPAMKLGQLVRPLLPASLKNKVPARAGARAPLADARAPAQGADADGLRAAGDDAQHQQRDRARARRRRHPDPGRRRGRLLRRDPPAPERPRRRPGRHAPQHRRLVAAGRTTGGVEAIVMNASGCGVTVKEYGHALARDPAYADKAKRISELTRDLSELLPDLVPRLKPKLRLRGVPTQLAFHPPCTLQHGQQLRGGVETHLTALGFDVQVARNESAPVLRLGRHLFGAAARARVPAARPQAREPRDRWPRRPSSRPTSAASSTCRPAPRRRCGTGSRCSTTRSPDRRSDPD